jgi:hypothetical protein
MINRATEVITSLKGLLDQSLKADQREVLFLKANENCEKILQSGSLVEKEIETTRSELVSKNSNSNVTVGESINFITEFYTRLRESESFQNFNNTKSVFLDLSTSDSDDVERLVEKILSRNILGYNKLKASSIYNFSKEFQELVQQIESKIQEQIKILKIQVHYAVSGDAQSVQENLKKTLKLLFINNTNAVGYFKDNPLAVESGVHHKLGNVILSPFHYDELIDGGEVVISDLNSEENEMIIENLRRNEEATVTKVVNKLHTLLKAGECNLKEYPFDHGLVEFMILSNIEAFSNVIKSKRVEKEVVDVQILYKEKTTFVRQVENQCYILVGENDHGN